jgi:hypothetical protein
MAGLAIADFDLFQVNREVDPKTRLMCGAMSLLGEFDVWPSLHPT